MKIKNCSKKFFKFWPRILHAFVDFVKTKQQVFFYVCVFRIYIKNPFLFMTCIIYSHIYYTYKMNEEFYMSVNSTVFMWYACVCASSMYVEKKNQLDVTWWFIVLMNCCTCFGHSYAHHQELETIPVLMCGAWCQRCWWSAGRCRAAGYVSRERDVDCNSFGQFDVSTLTKKRLFTVNTTSLILILISHINKAIYLNQTWSSSGHPVS
jgi:hypothetical protein